ncbi:MAG: hypothetical protein LBC99_07165 [Spirochaetota bacterium]|jgi:ABC-2 type transport system permease protein|nr:hypothetical protein [Spirochaetota bacterium]
MSKALALFRVQVFSFLNPVVLRRSSGREKLRMLLFICIAAGLAGVFAVYTAFMALGFSAAGMIEALPPLLLLLCVVVTLVCTFLKSSSIFFGFKDYDMIVSLPVRTGTIITSRLLSLYLLNLLFSGIVLVPGLVVFLYGAYPFEGWIIGFILLLFAPLLPLAIGVFVSGIITVLSMKLRYGSIVTVILSLICVILLVVFSVHSIPHKEADLAVLGAFLSQFAFQAYPPAEYFQTALVRSDWSAVLIFAFISVFSVLLLKIALGASFGKINSVLFSRSTRR